MTGAVIEPIPGWARGVRRLVVLSGAGISTDSGIPDFRGPNGFWTKDPGAHLRYTYQAFLADPELRASYWRSRRDSEVWTAEPNVGHRTVGELTGSAIDVTVITQNTDGLHQRGGAPADRVLELHGTILVTECVGCGHRSPTTQVLARIEAGEAVPACARCGGILKTASTMFGQTVSPEVLARASEAVEACDLLLAVGTSLFIEPAGSLCATAVRSGADLVIVNLGETPYDSLASEIVAEPLGTALPRVAAQLLAGVTAHPGAAGERGEQPAEAEDPQAAVRPSLLLDPRARTARLRGRTAELERLRRWCAGPDDRAHLVHGPAGAGKTRIALELADQLAQDGWDVRVLGPDDGFPVGDRPRLVVVDDAETRIEQARRVRQTAAGAGTVRLLLLARTADGWWDSVRAPADTAAELLPPDTAPDEALADDYTAALAKLRITPVRDRGRAGRVAGVGENPAAQQASVLAALLDPTGADRDLLVRRELAHLWSSARHSGLALGRETVRASVVTALLCGARDEAAAVTVLGHITALADDELRRRTARWLREVYPHDGPAYWSDALPGPVTTDLMVDCATPKFLLAMVSDTAPEQEERALAVLARACTTHPALRERLTQVLSLLPGLSPAAVRAALHRGYPGPLTDALTALVRTVPLPAELLEAVPPGTTSLGEFPVLLAASIVEAYEHRARTYPETTLPWLVDMQAELAQRLVDLGRVPEGLATARQAVERATQLADRTEHRARAAAALRRAEHASGAAPTTGNPRRPTDDAERD